MTLSLVSGLAACSGATTTTSEYCDIAFPLRLDHETTIDYLVADESQFVREVLAHNETHEELCK